jgi:hypothetical protein
VAFAPPPHKSSEQSPYVQQAVAHPQGVGHGRQGRVDRVLQALSHLG